MSTRFTALVLALTLSLGLLATPFGPSQDRITQVWNSFVVETKTWVAIRKNTLPVKGRNKLEVEAWERLKEKWAVVVLEVEATPHE